MKRFPQCGLAPAAVTLVTAFYSTPDLDARAQSSQAPSTVSGCIADRIGRPLPGGTVDVGSNGHHHIVFTDAAGCYAVRDLARGSYFVFARLRGFTSVTRDELAVESDRNEIVNIQMQPSSICECLVFPWSTVAGQWNDADMVVRVRVTAHDPIMPTKRHFAEVLQQWKPLPSTGHTYSLTFVQNMMPNEEEPYAVGQEFILFLTRDGVTTDFIRMSDGDDRVLAYALEDGRIHSAPIPRYVGMGEDDLLKELASLATR